MPWIAASPVEVTGEWWNRTGQAAGSSTLNRTLGTLVASETPQPMAIRVRLAYDIALLTELDEAARIRAAAFLDLTKVWETNAPRALTAVIGTEPEPEPPPPPLPGAKVPAGRRYFYS
jgi:hypothetical protein